MPPLTAEELQQFETHGAVTVDTSFTLAELEAAERGWDKLAAAQRELKGGDAERQGYREMGVRSWPTLAYDAATIDVLQHPWFEAVVKQALRADAGLFFQQSNNLVLPTPLPHPPAEEQWAAKAHCDTQLTTSDWEATPRRTVLCFWLWLSDVPERGGAMRYVPGSHLRTAAHWESVASPVGRLAMPRIYGTDIQERPAGRNESRSTLPESGEHGSWLREQEPVPLLARRGQCTVMTTALLHSPWYVHKRRTTRFPGKSLRKIACVSRLNDDSSPRKGMHFAWTAAGVPVGLPAGQDEDGQEIYPVLRERLRPERRHIIPEVYPHHSSEGPIAELLPQTAKL